MLTKFEVTNFKNFENKLSFDFKSVKKYQFNEECVKDNIITKALIYGKNATGKSNLGYAIFDIIKHLTSKNVNDNFYFNYTNANSKQNYASFSYEFKFKNGVVKYSYTKKDHTTLIEESLEINNELFAFINREDSNILKINAKGAENLNRKLSNKNISIISYIKNNANLNKRYKNNKLFFEFIEFVDNMLFFRSVNDGNSYMGHTVGVAEIDQDIIEQDNIKEFEKFLNELDINCKLDVINVPVLKEKVLVFKFKNRSIPFFDIASSGTKSLALFYFWIKRVQKEKISFIFIDEFDAFYHYELSRNIIKLLKKLDIQVVLTTHNTALMTNDLLRPDCYFIINNEKLKNLPSLTDKELREAHNLEKMYKANAFEI